MKIVTGRSGSGKSYYCMNEMKQALEEGTDCPLLYVVPEQFSLTSEYDLSSIIGRGGILEVQVLTFKRLCHRIYNEFGYQSETISKAGKAMLVYSVMKDFEKDLVLLNGVDKKAGLVSTVCDFISEFKRYNIVPEMLLNADTGNTRLGEKLKELAYIYAEYEKRIDGKFLDSDDDLRVVKAFIENSKLTSGAKIWIDGFDGFTPQELEVIKILNKIADVTIAITTDKVTSSNENISNAGNSTGRELFLLNRKTIEKLKRFANIDEVYLDKIQRFENPELIHLEENFNQFPLKAFTESNKSQASTNDMRGSDVSPITISMFPNMYAEVENIACSILSKVRDENYRFDQILVATRNMEAYKPILKMIFERYQIPYFVDDKSELSVQPLISLVTSLLDICSKSFQTDSAITYLKTGLTNIEDSSDIDLIENYVLKFGIKGTKWLDSWNYDKDEVNEKINSIREKIVVPIIAFKEKLASRKTVKEIATSLYEFLCDIHVQDNLERFLEKLNENNSEEMLSTDTMFMNSYLQVWNIFMNLLDELVAVMGDERISFEKFERALKAGVSSVQIGLIPTNKDQLVIGDISRSRNSHISILYVLGVNDGLFPMQYDDEGFLNDYERNLLLENHIEIAKDTKMLLLEENFNIYKILTTPKKELHISYPIADDSGSTLRPSMIISELKKMFPHIPMNDFVAQEAPWQSFVNTVDSTFVHLASEMRKNKNHEKIDKAWLEVYDWYKKNENSKAALIESGLGFQNTVSNLTKTSSQSLYGNTMNSSVSQMETFASCPFMYYLKYGLNVKERKVFKLATPDIGTFMHDILDQFAKHMEKNHLSWRELEKEDIDRISSQIVDDTLGEFKYSIFTSNNKLRFLSIKLKRVVKRVLWVITLQIKNSEFDVASSELEFGKGENAKLPAIEIELEEGNKVLLNGKIDRIDIAKTDDGKFIRVVDYKSSSKSINLSNVYYGLQLQLITYLDVVSKDDLLPGGALYLKLDDPIIKTKKDISTEEIEEEIRKKLRMDGIILADAKLVRAMDTQMISESSNLNLKLKKDGTYGSMPTANEEEIKLLMKHTKKILKQFAEEILNGKVENVPVKNDRKSPCSYCDYKEICNFDKELGNRFKKINELKNEEVFEQMKLF